MRDILERLAQVLPNLLGAIALVVVGWLAARLLRLATVRGARMLEALLARFAGKTPAERPRTGRAGVVLGTVVFWLVLLVFVSAAADLLGLRIFTDWLKRLVEYLPTLAAGLLIIIAGYILSGFVADLVHATATRLAPAQRTALARIAQGATLLLAILVGADQIGIRVTWLAILAAIVLASLLGGVTLAVSLGARSYIANLIGAHYLRQAFRVGERVRVAGFEGHILEVTPTALVIETGEGRVSLPASVYHEQPIVLLGGPGDG